MKRILIICKLLVVLFAPALGAELELIKSIGNDDDDNYLFGKLTGAILSKDKRIYVLDTKQHFIAMYDWNGTFVKKKGSQGEGPGSFNGPTGIDIYKKHVYFNDFVNRRIARLDLALENLVYFKISSVPLQPTQKFFMLDEHTMLSEHVKGGKELNSIKVLDITSEVFYSFFNHTPVKQKISNDPRLMIMSHYVMRSCFGVDRKSGRLLASFVRPDNPIEFYIYTTSGNFVDQFSYHEKDSRYKFPRHFITEPRNPPSKWHARLLDGIYFYKNYYVVILRGTSYKKEKLWFEEMKSKCIILDQKDGKVVTEFPIPWNLRTFYLSPDGYLLAAKELDDTPKLHIYKLKI